MAEEVRSEPGLIEPIRLEVNVRRSVEDAFTQFTTRMTAWWPMERFTFGPGRSHEVLMEPYVGGRFYERYKDCLLYTSPSPRDLSTSRMPSSA